MSIISKNKTRWGLFAIVLMSSTMSFGQSKLMIVTGACFQYDAAGNRVKRNDCRIDIREFVTAPDYVSETIKPPLGGVLVSIESVNERSGSWLAKPNSTAEQEVASGNVSKNGEVLGQVKPNEGQTNVFPNPTSLGVTIETNEFEPTATLELLDATGKILQKQALNNGLLDLTAYDSGAYNVRLSSATNLKVIRIVKVCN